ncbi:DNA-binding protein HU-beta [Orientia chuto str. Dubai]|uniref:DNA-binding protein HU-beta n=1 Tax=Orientia chuto str. Dubai TaxID=1359168 RepID=A0A0F3MQ96_9RICK|nr:HU family DNA-binding protein [Candidatus Orientia mediorientalis]KJV56769.1 DNA-binding protein HU-beta [Orientia chuto str. Dubai]
MNTNNQPRKSLNKGEFINFIHSKRNKIIDDKIVKTDIDKVTKADLERALNLVLRSVEEAIKSGFDINIVGFGSFCVRFRAARDGHNPKTGAKINIAARKQVVFKVGKLLKDACN